MKTRINYLASILILTITVAGTCQLQAGEKVTWENAAACAGCYAEMNPGKTVAQVLPDISAVSADLETPSMESAQPAPGKRVKMVAPGYLGTDVYHALYLPTDWEKPKKYPVIVEYAGNKWRTSPGTVEGSNLGYGISGGKGVIWVCMPFVDKKNKRNAAKWWGDVEATVEYCKATVELICTEYGGDRSNVFIAGFSRGAIACNYIGLHDDEIASLWRGFICHSHYDGVREWAYAASDRKSAAERLKRLKGRPQFISQERSVAKTEQYLKKAFPGGDFTFQALPFANHTDTWVLRDVPARKAVRQWFRQALSAKEIQDGPNAGWISVRLKNL